MAAAVERDLEWPGCVNVRDLGGLATAGGSVTAFGAVVRADNARRLTEAGWRAARGYGIRTVVDLRSDDERGADLPAPDDVEVETLSLFHDFDADPTYRADLVRRLEGCGIVDAYRLLYREALERHADRCAAALRLVAAAKPGGVLVHCAGGKDRTGVVAALLLRLVGVPTELVVADYERSEHRLGVADSAPAGVMDVVLGELEERHGGVEAYVRAAGVTDDEVARLRARLGVARPERVGEDDRAGGRA